MLNTPLIDDKLREIGLHIWEYSHLMIWYDKISLIINNKHDNIQKHPNTKLHSTDTVSCLASFILMDSTELQKNKNFLLVYKKGEYMKLQEVI